MPYTLQMLQTGHDIFGYDYVIDGMTALVYMGDVFLYRVALA